MSAPLRPITLVEIHGQAPWWRTIEPREQRTRDRSLRGKARIHARRAGRRG